MCTNKNLKTLCDIYKGIKADNLEVEVKFDGYRISCQPGVNLGFSYIYHEYSYGHEIMVLGVGLEDLTDGFDIISHVPICEVVDLLNKIISTENKSCTREN